MIGSDSYKVEGGFESAVVYFLATSRGFPYRFINHLSADLFTSPYAQLFVELLIKYFKKKGRVPGSIPTAINLVAQWHNHGKITNKVKKGTVEYLNDTVWNGIAVEERDCAQQFAELMQSWMHYKATHMAIGLSGERRLITDVAKYIEEANALLNVKEEAETYAHITDIATWVELIGKSGSLHRWPTGVAEWDIFFDGGSARGTLLIIIGPSGCHRAGTKIMLPNGRLRKVEGIEPGDQVMGTSGPRRVLRLHRGHETMVRITPIKGSPWVVNINHILTLVCTVGADRGTMIDVSVKEWMGWSQYKKATHKLLRLPVEEFQQAAPQPAPLDPYFMGVLLGDGSWSHGSVMVHKADPEIKAMCEAQAKAHGLRCVKSKDNTTTAWRLSGPDGVGRGPSQNPVIDALRELDLWDKKSGTKFIPSGYKYGSRETRLQVLAGLLDTDGHMTHGGFDWVSKSKRLARDTVFVARSLGLAAYMKRCVKGCQNGFSGTYYRVSISGDCHLIPNRIERKKAAVRRQVKSVLRTGFSVEVLPPEPYYGFELDGDGRYLLSDFTVTHNSGKSITLSQMCASCCLRGGDAAYISLEVDKAQVASRIMAPIAGLPIDFVVKRTDGIGPYLEMTYRRTHTKLGNLYVEHYPEGSTVNEVLVSLDKAFEAGEKKGKARPKHFYFDYLDRFGGGSARGKDLYTTGADVTQAIRNYISHWEAWGASACQSKRFISKAAYKESGLDDVADSMHKVRIADDVINLLLLKDGPNGDEIASKVSKHRAGKSGQKTQYHPVDYSYGIIFPSSDFRPVPMAELAYDPYFADLAMEKL